MEEEKVDELVDKHTKWFVDTIEKIYRDAMRHGYKHGSEDEMDREELLNSLEDIYHDIESIGNRYNSHDGYIEGQAEALSKLDNLMVDLEAEDER